MDERHLTATLSVIGEVQPQGEGASSSCKYTPMSGKFWFGIKKTTNSGPWTKSIFLVVSRIVWACACFEQATSLAKSIHTGQQRLGKSVDSPPPPF